jgi:hypothetical protein
MIIYVAVLALCLDTCKFAYSDPFESKAKCVAFLKQSTAEFPKEVLSRLSGVCVPVKIDDFT